MDAFELEVDEFIELDNLMKITGMCGSGGMAKTMIAEGRVMVDGKVELRRRCKIRAGQIVTIGSREVRVTKK
jgi:ribosome-associated protein